MKSNLSAQSKKIRKNEIPKQEHKNKQHFSSKMNQNNTFYEEKPDFDYLALKYPDFEPQ